MLGVVFTEFTEMVESQLGVETLDRMLSGVEQRLESGGAYTAVGTYSHSEMVVLVTELARITGLSTDALVEQFGHHLFGRFNQRYPMFFNRIDNALDFLETVEGRIHFQVRKLYPAAQLPTFVCTRSGADTLVMEYRSSRPFAALALGLIRGCGDHFGQPLEVTSESLPKDDNGMRFTVRRR
ncbi:MAG TPA: heme NO-binding domain-containing protein [Gammaproteobacteria bacterium]